jgi:ferredoxin
MVTLFKTPIPSADCYGDIMIVKEWCMYCGECAGVCPRNLIQVRELTLEFNREECKDCKICIQVCPVNALEEKVV